MKTFGLLSVILVSSIAQADVSSSFRSFNGYIKGVVVRSDLKEVRVVVTCGSEQGSITFSEKNYSEGLALINSTGKYLQVSMFNTIKNRVNVSEYSISNEQELQPGDVICK